MKTLTAEVAHENGTLTARESQQLKAAEADVEKGGKLIVAAMELIRDQRLYRATHETFADYCRERWNRTARSVNNAIQMEAVVQRIAEHLPDGNGKHVSQTHPILTRRAAAEVADMPAETAAAVVAKAAENGKKPTAKAVAEAREEVAPKGAAVSEFFDAKKPKISGGVTFNVNELGGKTSPTSLTDTIGREVPKSLNAAASTAAAIDSLARKIDPIRREAEQLAQTDGGAFLEMTHVNMAARDLKNAISQARYWTACPRCDGKGCDRCGKSGFIPFAKRGQLSAEDKATLGIE